MTFLNWNNLWKFYIRILYPDIRISGFYIRISGFYIRNLFVSDTTSWKISHFHCTIVTWKSQFSYPVVFQNKTSFLFWNQATENPCSSVGMRAAANIRIVPDAPSPFPSPQDPGLLDNQSLLCIHSLTVNREAILEDQRFLKKYFPRQGSFIHTTYIWEGGWEQIA